MILVDIKVRQDNLFDMYVGDEGDQFVHSAQGYANVEDCVAIARRLFQAPGPANPGDESDHYAPEFNDPGTEHVVMRVTYRDGKTWTERLR